VKEEIDTSIDPRAERLVRECIGRLQGRFMYSETEARDTIAAVLAKPVPRKNNGYIATEAVQAQPYRPGIDPKPKFGGAQ
jgi:hypothetical protein